MKVGVVYATRNRHAWLSVDVPEGATVAQAIEASGVMKQFPEINLEQNKTGVFGKAVKPDTVLEDGDRVEIYRALIADPKKVPRKKDAAAKEAPAKE
ncbi:MAG: RnfH family protein [Alphaproteobacteria bacterium]|nr:RnfH family protein [Alphaproteobacteria bacterium]MBF0128635.1 RnfH family protein [Alphaproteobacteria bacterium]